MREASPIDTDFDPAVPVWNCVGRIAWGVMVVFLPWRLHLVLLPRSIPPIYRDYTDFIALPSDLALVVALLSALLARRRSQRRLSLGPPVLSLALGGLILASAVSIIPSPDRPGSIYQLARLLLLAGLYLFLLNHPVGWGWIVIPVGLQVAIQGVIAIAQSLRQASIGLSFLGEYGLNPSWSGVGVVLSDGQRILRAYGLSVHPNILGGCLAVSGLVLLAAFAGSRGNERPWLLALLGLAITGLLVTFSRAAAFAFAAGVLALAGGIRLIGKRREWRGLWQGLGAAALLTTPFLLGYGPTLFTRAGLAGGLDVNPLEIRSLTERSTLNIAAAQLFLERPLTGVGLGAVPLALATRFPEFSYPYQPAHIALLDAAAETGIPGALFYALATVGPWIALLYRARLHPPGLGLLAASAALLVITIVGFFDYYPWVLTPGRLLQWSIWGIWAREFMRPAMFPRSLPTPGQLLQASLSVTRGNRVVPLEDIAKPCVLSTM